MGPPGELLLRFPFACRAIAESYNTTTFQMFVVPVYWLLGGIDIKRLTQLYIFI